MKKLPKSTIVLSVLGLLFFFSSFSFLISKSYTEFITGIVIALVLLFIGYTKYKNSLLKSPSVDDITTKMETTPISEKLPSPNKPVVHQENTAPTPVEPAKTIVQEEKKPEPIVSEPSATLIKPEKPTEPVTVDRQSEPRIIKLPELRNSELKYSYDDVDIAGYNNYDWSNVPVGVPLDITRELDNEYDSNAVSFSYNKIKLGYLHKGRLQSMVHDFRNRNGSAYALVENLDPPQILLGFYEYVENEYDKLMQSDVKRKVFKLTGTGTEKIQSNLVLCHVGEEVTAEYDYDKEKYLAVCGWDIGFFPKSAEELLEGNFKAFISEKEIDDNIKYYVKVAIFT